MSEWRTTTLGAECAAGGGEIQTGPFGSQLHAHDYVEIGTPVVMPVNIGENRIDERGIARITADDVERLSRHRLKSGDIVYSRRGDITRRALISDREDGWLCGTGCLRIRVGDGDLDPTFLSYQLGHPRVHAWLERHAVGATMLNLNTSILSEVPLAVPPREEQMRVAGVLKALDSKIDHNLFVARALITRAQLLSHAARLHWTRVGSLGDITAPSRVIAVGDDVDLPYVGLESMAPGSPIVDKWLTDDAPQGQAFRFKRGDILFGKLRPYFKKVGVVPIDGRCSTEILVLEPSESVMWSTVFAYVTSDAFIAHCEAVSRGTKMPRAEWKDAALFKVALPTQEQAAQLDEEVQPMIELVLGLTLETERLRQTRDLLLPALVLGDRRVDPEYDPSAVFGSAWAPA